MAHSVAEPVETLAARTPHRLLMTLAALWTLLWTLLTLIEIPKYLHDPLLPLWQPVALVLSSLVVVVAWLASWFHSGAYESISLPAPTRWLTRQLIWLPVLIVGCVACVYGLRYGIFSITHTTYWHIPWHPLFAYEAIKVTLFYGLWLGLAFGCRTVSDWREQHTRLIDAQHALTAARLDQLKAQLRPHFLFNTLNTISSLMQTDVPRADRLLTRFADLLRTSLSVSEHDLVPFQTELQVLRLYTEIMQERFDGKVSIDWNIEEATLHAQMPTMLLQPLLENAFQHGVEKCLGHHHIVIRAHRDVRCLIVSIHSGGELTGDVRMGVGLSNCRERLRVLFGESASLSLNNAQQGGVLTTLSLPCLAEIS